MIAALLVAASAVLPWVRYGGPTIGNDLVSVTPAVELTPGGELDEDGMVRSLALGFAVAIGLLALALIATRVRGLGVVWRLLALLVVAGPAVATWAIWTQVIANPTSSLEGDSVVLARVMDLGIDLGLLTVEAGPGLWALSVGAALGLLAIIVPAGRSTTFVPVPGMPYGPPGYPPGYPPPGYGSPYPPNYPPGGAAPGRS